MGGGIDLAATRDGAAAAAGGRVTFDSQGETVAGHLFPAAFGAGPAPAVAIIGPMTFVKEQAPTLYAQRLSQLKRLLWDGPTRHPQYYDDPAVIDQTVWNIADWFSRHLGPGSRPVTAAPQPPKEDTRNDHI